MKERGAKLWSYVVVANHELPASSGLLLGFVKGNYFDLTQGSVFCNMCSRQKAIIIIISTDPPPHHHQQQDHTSCQKGLLEVSPSACPTSKMMEIELNHSFK